MLDSDHIPATKTRRNRDTEHVLPTSCKRIKFDDVIFRPVVKDESCPDLKAESVSDDVISEISTESSNAKKKNNSPSNEATSRRQPSPSSEEIDEFFKEAEKYQHKRFVEK
ncbi:cyclin-dependent kinase inhibitor 7-like protein [Tanacetum coccineum]